MFTTTSHNQTIKPYHSLVQKKKTYFPLDCKAKESKPQLESGLLSTKNKSGYRVQSQSIIQGHRKWYGLNGNGRTGFWLNLF